jgi:hypothetical protein
MNEKTDTISANIQWFNQFFDGMRNIYGMVLEQLPAEYFPTTATTQRKLLLPAPKIVPVYHLITH